VENFFCEVLNEGEEEVVDLYSNAALPIVSLSACELNASYFACYEVWVMINCKYVSKTHYKN
jgi:hypothetical protein